MLEHVFFFAGLSLILTHEMDAVRLQEWRIFPVLSSLRDEQGYLWFTAIHIPLYLAIFFGIFAGPKPAPDAAFIAGLDIFFAVHVLLHAAAIRHRNNQFRSSFSWFLILGAGVCGVLDLAIGG